MSGAQTAAISQRPAAPSLLRDFVTLTKPKVQSLLLFTTVTTMYVAGDPSLKLIFLTCLGGALSAGGAGAINHAVDRDIDRAMARTADRPVASGRISARAAIAFGVLLGCSSFALLALTVNPLAAALSLSGLFGYVFVYTLWLKRTTPQNIVIGGAAGALPPVIGWAAATGEIGLEPIILFLIIFLWTPPHFWALSLNRSDEYARAGVPMLPVVAGRAATTRQILIYSVLLVPTSVLPWALGFAGTIYGAAAVIGGTVLIVLSFQLSRSSEADRRSAHRLFVFSIFYLFVLFAALLTGSGNHRWSSMLSSWGAWTVAENVQAESLARLVRTACSSTTVRADEV